MVYFETFLGESSITKYYQSKVFKTLDSKYFSFLLISSIDKSRHVGGKTKSKCPTNGRDPEATGGFFKLFDFEFEIRSLKIKRQVTKAGSGIPENILNYSVMLCLFFQ